jgi:hypothetical protein
MLRATDEATQGGASFAFETMLANRDYAGSFRAWQAADYHLSLWFLALPSTPPFSRCK